MAPEIAKENGTAGRDRRVIGRDRVATAAVLSRGIAVRAENIAATNPGRVPRRGPSR